MAIVEQARELRLLSEAHFCVDGTWLEAWASLQSSTQGRRPTIGRRLR